MRRSEGDEGDAGGSTKPGSRCTQASFHKSRNKEEYKGEERREGGLAKGKKEGIDEKESI